MCAAAQIDGGLKTAATEPPQRSTSRSQNKERHMNKKFLTTTALTEAMSGKQVSTASTRPYGCSVKYAN
jgi:hypothetical protein